MKHRLSPLLLLPVLLALQPASAQDRAGDVIFAAGTVSAEREPPVPLVKGDAVLVSDTVKTGEASRAQLLMIDGARIAIRPDSELRIDEYQHAAASPSQGVVSAGGDRSVTTLIKGGFRTITGAIGKDNEEDYEVRTAVGVLGIRGTDYTAVFCNADCQNAPGATSTPPENGLYLGVADGTIVFRNESGDLVLRAGQYAFIPLESRRPERLSVPPPVLIEGPENDPLRGAAASPAGFDSKLGSRRKPDVGGTAAAGDSADGRPQDGDEAPEQPLTGTDADGSPIDLTPGQTPPQNPPPPGNRSISWSSGPLFGAQGVAFAGALDNGPAEYSLDANSDLAGFIGLYPALRQGGETATFDINSSSVAESGGDTLTVMRWGRWSGGTAGIALAGGGDVDQDLASQSLHWVIGPDWGSTPPVIPVTGTASYSLVGGTSPTDDFGNVGTLTSATFDADFTNQLVDSTLTIDFAQQQWIASGTGQLGSLLDPVRPAYLFLGNYSSVSINGVAGGNGTFSGFFSEPGPVSDPAFPGGVGLTYSLQDGGGSTTVSGAAVFGNP